MRSSGSESQEQRILNALHAAWPGEVPAIALSKISLQFCARIFSLRRRGWTITNRIQCRQDGTKCSFYRLGAALMPRSSELRSRDAADKPESKLMPGSPDLLFDLPEREHRDDG
jgi:hypothetical protein